MFGNLFIKKKQFFRFYFLVDECYNILSKTKKVQFTPKSSKFQIKSYVSFGTKTLKNSTFMSFTKKQIDNASL